VTLIAHFEPLKRFNIANDQMVAQELEVLWRESFPFVATKR